MTTACSVSIGTGQSIFARSGVDLYNGSGDPSITFVDVEDDSAVTNRSSLGGSLSEAVMKRSNCSGLSYTIPLGVRHISAKS